MKRLIFTFVLGCFVAIPLVAQTPDELLGQGQKAFQEQRFEEAERLLSQAAERAPENPETHYLLSKLYYDTPLRDVGKASDEIHKALDLEPDNVKYKTARLQLLRRDAPNFIVERLRDEKRRQLAHEILQLDSLNAFAHEELGISYIHDFWRYRNAKSIPNLSFATTTAEREELERMERLQESSRRRARPSERENVGRQPPMGSSNRSWGTQAQLDDLDPSTIFAADRFDLEALEARGVPVQDLSARADYAYDRAIEHLRKALEIDPRRRAVYDRLMQVHVLKEEPRKALTMLEEMYVNFPDDPALWLYLGYAHHKLDHRQAASKSFQEAFERMETETKRAFQDIGYFLSDDEKNRYRADSTRFSARFWTSKDPRYLTPFNERKLEHYARLVRADLLYDAPDLDKRGWETKRGRILVRYGEPNINAVLFARGSSQSFFAPPGMQGKPGFGDKVAEENAFNIWDYGDFRFVFEDPFRNGEYRLYSPPADELGGGTPQPWANDYVIKARETFREHPDRYEYESSGRRVQLPYVVSTFRGKNEKTDVYVHYGIPLNTQSRIDSTLEVTARVGTYLIGEDRDILVERRRTIYGFKPEQIHSFKESNLWMSTQSMEAPPGAHQLSMEFETSGTGTFAVQRRDVKVPRYGEEELAISDLLLAYQIEVTPDGEPLGAADVVRDGLSIQPAPWSVFSVDQPIYIFFEGYNMAKNGQGQTNYAVEAALVPKDTDEGVTKFIRDLFGGGAEEGVSVQFEGTGRQSDAGQYLIMDATDEDPGIYTLIVRLKDTISGETAETERDLYLE